MVPDAALEPAGACAATVSLRVSRATLLMPAPLMRAPPCAYRFFAGCDPAASMRATSESPAMCEALNDLRERRFINILRRECLQCMCRAARAARMHHDEYPKGFRLLQPSNTASRVSISMERFALF